MSVSLESLLRQSVCCHMAHGEEYHGRLEALDGSFDVVLSQCRRSRAARNQPPEPLVFIRGENIIYIGFDESARGKAMALPGVSHYERMPTRTKLQFFWISMLTMGFAYQFVRMTVFRVQPKREEQMYMHIKKVYGDNIPEELLQLAKRQREAQDALTLTNMLRTPTPGQTSNALQNDLDPRALLHLKSWNGN